MKFTSSLARRPLQPPASSLSRLAAAAALLALAACGGGGGGGAASDATAAAATATALAAERASPQAADSPATREDASRFLTQASFGPDDYNVELLMKIGYSAWLDRQFAMAPTSHRAWWEAADAALKAQTPPLAAGQDEVWQSFWKQALNGQDQLRLRVAFALSQIFVISAVDGNIGNQPRAMAAWLDMLGEKSFGTYRDLLESVSLHPLMGLYLSWLKNQKPDAATGRIPDQNYARESMQLLSIGLVKLNLDGTPVLVNGQPVETYGPADVAGLSHVFTGWSYACPNAPTNSNCFFNGSGTGGASDPDRYFKPMVPYPQYHSVDAKNFLGVTIPAVTTANSNPVGDLKIGLDTLANHANVAPFIVKQLIQRLVTSNPSPAYVQAVAQVFNDNGAGARGDLKAVVKAILLHPEARNAGGNTAGKVREPVLKLSAYMRAFPHTSDTGSWRMGNTDSAATSLGQTPLRAGSVFNFYRPGYVAPGTATAAAGLVAPEMQLLNETSAAGWVNAMRDNLTSGVGQFNGTVNGVALNRRDMQRDWSQELALAPRSVELVSRVTTRLMYGTASPALQQAIVDAVNKITIPATGQSAIDTAKRNRVNAAVLLTLASPEFQVQK